MKLDPLEYRELIAHLTDIGFGPLLTLMQDHATYTKNGRLKISAVARGLNTTGNKAQVLVEAFRDAAKCHSGDKA